MREAENVEVVFEPQAGGGFTVYSPEFPGMVTEGETMEEATANAQEAITLYVESMREIRTSTPSWSYRATRSCGRARSTRF